MNIEKDKMVMHSNKVNSIDKRNYVNKTGVDGKWVSEKSIILHKNGLGLWFQPLHPLLYTILRAKGYLLLWPSSWPEELQAAAKFTLSSILF